MDKKVFMAAGWVLGLVALAILAQRVGGIAVRVSGVEIAQLSVVEPVVLGVPTRVDWSGFSGSVGGARLIVRTQAGENEVWRGSVATRRALVVFSCDTRSPASVELRADSGAVLAQSQVEYLDAGVDCF